MLIAKIIGYISIAFWLFPPFRQYKRLFFYYFLILAISDPFALFCVQILGRSPQLIYPIAGLLLFYAINPSKTALRRFWAVHMIFITGFSICFFYFENLLYLTLIMHLLILFKFVRIVMLKAYGMLTLNIFHLALIFYELSVVINLLEFLGNNDFRVVIYYITLTFQIIMAIFFTIFTEKSDLLIIRLKSAD